MRASSREVTTTNRDCCGFTKATHLEFENLIALYYWDLYRFAMRLARNDADALDLTQQTFYVWAKKGHQLRDAANVKSWLFTTLRREFLQTLRRQSYFADTDWTQAAERSPPVSPNWLIKLMRERCCDFLLRMKRASGRRSSCFSWKSFPTNRLRACSGFHLEPSNRASRGPRHIFISCLLTTERALIGARLRRLRLVPRYFRTIDRIPAVTPNLRQDKMACHYCPGRQTKLPTI